MIIYNWKDRRGFNWTLEVKQTCIEHSEIGNLSWRCTLISADDKKEVWSSVVEGVLNKPPSLETVLEYWISDCMLVKMDADKAPINLIIKDE